MINLPIDDTDFELRQKALPVEARIEFIRRTDIARSLIYEARILSIEEAKKCAPFLRAEKRVEAIVVISGLLISSSIIIAGAIIAGDVFGQRTSNLVGGALIFCSVIFASLLRTRLGNSRNRLFGPRWQPIEQRWHELGLHPLTIEGVGIHIVEVNELYARKPMSWLSSSTDENLESFFRQVQDELLRHIESSLSPTFIRAQYRLSR